MSVQNVRVKHNVLTVLLDRKDFNLVRILSSPRQGAAGQDLYRGIHRPSYSCIPIVLQYFLYDNIDMTI